MHLFPMTCCLYGVTSIKRRLSNVPHVEGLACRGHPECNPQGASALKTSMFDEQAGPSSGHIRVDRVVMIGYHIGLTGSSCLIDTTVC